MNLPLPVPRAALEGPTRLILDNHRRWLGRELIPTGEPNRAVEDLFAAPCVVLAALGPVGTDHVFCYANHAALTLFETPWDGLVGHPSSASAEPVHRDERKRLLDEVARHGFIANYAGIRISRKGRRFRILHATVFNLLDQTDNHVGQAATFADWEPLD
jgi:hypothetical protein